MIQFNKNVINESKVMVSNKKAKSHTCAHDSMNWCSMFEVWDGHINYVEADIFFLIFGLTWYYPRDICFSWLNHLSFSLKKNTSRDILYTLVKGLYKYT